MQLLAILGRGIRKKQDGSWVPARDLEMYGDNFAPIVELRPVNDDDPNCLVGGGELNIRAGAKLIGSHQHTLEMVACAYGGRSRYLTEVIGPSEAEIMTLYLAQFVPWSTTQVLVWPREQQTQSGETNTRQELANIFALAVNRGYTEVGIVTVLAHYARTVLMASRHLQNPAFVHLKLECFVSEGVLLRYNPDMEERIKKLHASRAFMRTMFYECRGLNALLAGKY